MDTTIADLPTAYASLRSQIFDIAQRYVDGGLQIVCVASALCPNKLKRGKSPTHLGWQATPLSWAQLKREMDRVWSREGGCNIGLKTGKYSKIVCVDVDQRSGGMGWYVENEMHLGNPLVEKTPTGGLHLYYRYPSSIGDGEMLLTRSSKSQCFKGVDILSDGGGQVVTYPSIHANGSGQYELVNGMNLLDVQWEADELPEWIVSHMLSTQKKPIEELEGKTSGASGEADEVDVQQAIILVQRFPAAIAGDGGDLQTLRVAMACKDFGLSVSQVVEVMAAHYNERCSPPWTKSELVQKVQNAFKYGRNKTGINSMTSMFPGTSAVIQKAADALAANNAANDGSGTGGSGAPLVPQNTYSKRNAVFSARVYINRNVDYVRCFNSQWYMYDAEIRCWRYATDFDLEQSIMLDFDRSTNGGRNYLTARAGFFADCRKMVKGMLNVNVEKLPEGTWLSGRRQGDGFVRFQNGILDLHSGELISHSSDFFSFQCLPFEYEVSATCETFLGFLTTIWDGDEELIESLRMWMAYIVLPQCNLHRLAMFQGASRAGKSTIAGVMENLVGSGATGFPTLGGLAGDFGIGNLLGKRLLVIQEADRLGGDRGGTATERIKMIASNEPMEINRKGKDILYQQLNAKLVLICNNVPAFANSQGSLTNRIVMFPFWNTFQDKEDFQLGFKLRAETAGVFNWLMPAIVKLLDGGETVRLPQAMRGIVGLQEMAEQLDSIEAFVSECVSCTVLPQDFISSKGLWRAYRNWCKESGRLSKSRQAFLKDLANRKLFSERRGIRRVAGTQQRGYEGLKVVDEFDDVFDHSSSLSSSGASAAADDDDPDGIA
jgi:putative DNA primase/helicase